MMTVIQNAFANTSSSIVISKVQGNIVDTLMPPLSPLELVLGYVAGWGNPWVTRLGRYRPCDGVCCLGSKSRIRCGRCCS